MAEMKIHIFPYFKEIVIPVKDKVCEEVLHVINKIKPNWNEVFIEIPDIGYRGFELYCDGYSVFAYDQFVLYTSDNITQLLKDSKKRIYYVLLKIALKEYQKELIYFLDVKKYEENRLTKRKKKSITNRKSQNTIDHSTF